MADGGFSRPKHVTLLFDLLAKAPPTRNRLTLRPVPAGDDLQSRGKRRATDRPAQRGLPPATAGGRSSLPRPR